MKDQVTCEEAIQAIEKAREVFVYVRTSISCDGLTHHTKEFPVTKDLAIDAMRELRDLQHAPNIVISDGGARVVVGRHPTADPLPNLGHQEDNNGNF